MSQCQSNMGLSWLGGCVRADPELMSHLLLVCIKDVRTLHIHMIHHLRLSTATSDLLSQLIHMFKLPVSLKLSANSQTWRGKDENDAWVPAGESGQEAGGVSSLLGRRMIDFRVRNNQPLTPTFSNLPLTILAVFSKYHHKCPLITIDILVIQ